MNQEAQAAAEAKNNRGTEPAKCGIVVATKETAPFVQGRREFFQYRDLGVTDATDGRMRAQVTFATQGLSKPTGWHYHECEAQFNYMLSGWVELQCEDGKTLRLSAGDSFYIPPGFRHNEIRTSESFEVIEISVPAKMGTVACDPPEDWLTRQTPKI
jgi:quercetin dioxygenase-like cupin family protein